MRILRPYGNHLLTPGANLWFRFMGILIFIMAIMEGLTWGLVSSFVLPPQVWWGSIGVGVIIFLIIAIIDISLVTLDVSPPLTTNDANQRKQGKFRMGLKVWAGGLIRMGMASVSVLITAPYLSQVLLYDDINQVLERNHGAVRQNLLQEIETEYPPQIKEVKLTLSSLRDDLKKEAAGRGLSGRKGSGPTTRAMEREILKIEADQTRLLAEYEQRRKEVLVYTDQDLAQISDQFIPNTFPNRTKIYQELISEKGQDYARAEILAGGLLGITFMILFLLKVFQNQSITIYLNENLQDLYEQYLQGMFNDVLSPEEHPHSGNPMTPYRFEYWVYTFYAQGDNLEEMSYRKNVQETGYNMRMNQLEGFELTLSNRVQLLRQQLKEYREEEPKNEEETKLLEKEIQSEKELLRKIREEKRKITHRVVDDLIEVE